MDQFTAQVIIEQTIADYQAMAVEFSRSRGHLPSDLLALKEYIIKGEIILDLGCGNGRFSELVAPEDYFGADACEALVKIAQEKYPNKKFASVEDLQLPFPDRSFDKVFCLAVIHHLPSAAYRRLFLAEIKRVLKPGGVLVLTAWYLLDKPNIWRQFIKTAAQKLLGKNKMDFGDLFLPFKNPQGKVLAQRYFHAFSITGLCHLLRARGFIIETVGLVKRNKNRNIQIIARWPLSREKPEKNN